jgi:hypothetical protein
MIKLENLENSHREMENEKSNENLFFLSQQKLPATFPIYSLNLEKKVI